MRVLIAAGGTGGHVFPAVAVAARLKEKGASLFWIGRPDSLEQEEAEQLQIPFAATPLIGIRRRLTLRNLTALWLFLRGRQSARKAIEDFRPHVLFALGSYVSAPIISVALALAVPVVLHEQNVTPGLVVRHYAKRVSLLLLNQPLVEGGEYPDARVVGLPIRERLLIERNQDVYREFGLQADRRTLFIFGGSQGARAFCELGIDIASDWVKTRPGWQVLLQTGDRNWEFVKSRTLPSNLVVFPQTKEMGKAYACADCIIARSGAVTCAELEAVGKPAILTPYPFAASNHQHKNAECFVRKNEWARLVPQRQMSVGKVNEALEELSETAPSPKTPGELDKPVRQIVSALEEASRLGEDHERS